MKVRFSPVAAESAERAAASTAREVAGRASGQPQPPSAEATAAQQPSQGLSVPRKRVRWILVLVGVLVLVAGNLAAKRLPFHRPPLVASYNSRLAALDTKLSGALASQLRAAGYEFDAAIVSVEGPICQRAVCLVKGLRREDLMGLPGRMAGRHLGNGLWSFAGTGELAGLKFNVDATAEMRRLAESTPPEFPQVPVSAAPIESPGQTASPFNREFELWLPARADGRQGQWLDLETGRSLTEPDWEYLASPLSYLHWLRSNSLDLAAAVYPDGSYWIFTRHLVVAPVDAKLWDRATPDDIVSHPALRSAAHRIRGSFSPGRDQADTYLLRTEEGAMGILRVLRLNRVSQELRIHYKLVLPRAKAINKPAAWPLTSTAMGLAAYKGGAQHTIAGYQLMNVFENGR
jgi:hypothetical protein